MGLRRVTSRAHHPVRRRGSRITCRLGARRRTACRQTRTGRLVCLRRTCRLGDITCRTWELPQVYRWDRPVLTGRVLTVTWALVLSTRVYRDKGHLMAICSIPWDIFRKGRGHHLWEPCLHLADHHLKEGLQDLLAALVYPCKDLHHTDPRMAKALHLRTDLDNRARVICNPSTDIML